MATHEQIMRSWRVSNLAREQALLGAADETLMDAKLVLKLNRASLPSHFGWSENGAKRCPS